MARKIKYNEDLICTICKPRRRFKDGISYGRHMVKFHKLKAEVYTTGKRKGYNTGWWVRK